MRPVSTACDDGAMSETVAPQSDGTARHTASILERAQAYADATRADADRVLAEARTVAERLRSDAQVLHDEADSMRAEVEPRHRRATEVVERAETAARELLAAAAAQAAAITARATQQADAALAEALDLARARAESALEDAARIRAQAEAELADGRALLRAETDERDAANEAWVRDAEERLASSRTELDDLVRTRLAAADAEAARLRAAAHAEAEELRLRAELVIEQAREHATGIREVARQDIEAQRATADEDVAKLLQEAREHLDWSHATAESTPPPARHPPEAERRQAHQALTDHLRTRRHAVIDILGRTRHKVTTQVRDAAAESERIRGLAAAVLAAAEQAGARTTGRAEEEAGRTLAAAREEAAEIVARAERRLTEAREGAQVLRESTTAELDRLHRESLERHRLQRAELVALTDEARADADRIRSEAAEMLEQARAEVEALARRRSDITTQLGALSGVIDALAVPASGTEQPAADRDGADAPIDADHPSHTHSTHPGREGR